MHKKDLKGYSVNFKFFTRKFYTHQRHKPLNSEQKLKNESKKHLRGKNLIIRLFAFYVFAWLHICTFSTFST